LKQDVSVFGAGSFGTALAQAFARGGKTVRIWARSRELVHEINTTRHNSRHSGSTRLHESISATADVNEALHCSEIWVYACPSSYFSEFLKSHVHSQKHRGALVNAAKGLDPSRMGFFHDTVAELLGSEFLNSSYYALSGPSFAKEIIDDHITCVTLAGLSAGGLKNIQHHLSHGRFRLYTSTDLLGVQLGGAMKNVLAIASGVLAGMSVGVNTQSAFVNLGLGEMARLGVAMGARLETFLGFSGMGDLVLTCSSPLSRNRSFGECLGRGLSLAEASQKVGATIEGVKAAPIVQDLIRKYKVRAPVSEAVAAVVLGQKSLNDAFHELLSHPPREEWL
jgi:glycerol-3-phosphate dehydrogenase (NAD(P)+)